MLTLTAISKRVAVAPPATESASPREVLDEALISAIASGDRDAMKTLYQRHTGRVHRFVLHLVTDAASAEDIVSEVFLALWHQAGSFKAKS